MKQALNLQELKSLLAFSREKEVFHFKEHDLKIPRGAITKIQGIGKTKFVLEFLAEQEPLQTIWIESQFSFYPYSLIHYGLDPKNFLFIESGEQTSFAVLQALKSQAFQILIIYQEEFDLTDLRRFQLFSEKSKVTTVWLTNSEKNYWPISLELRIEQQSKTRIHILRER